MNERNNNTKLQIPIMYTCIFVYIYLSSSHSNETKRGENKSSKIRIEWILIS